MYNKQIEKIGKDTEDSMNNEILRRGLASWKMESSSAIERDFEIYKDLLLQYNKVMNLTNITKEDEVYTKHFLDSISCLYAYDIHNGARLIDVGTGAGFPSLPMKIMRRDLHLTLLDSLNKRVEFLRKVGEALSLEKVDYIHSRAEDLARDPLHRETYDFAVSRAVANLSTLLEYTVPFLKKGGILLCQKGPQVEEELHMAKTALKLLGARLIKKVEIPLEGTDLAHNILVIKKVETTAKKYPRKAGKPSKEPL